ncbi:MAG: hypothetical protein ACXWB9_09515 [Flavisolibacter sp.]
MKSVSFFLLVFISIGSAAQNNKPSIEYQKAVFLNPLMLIGPDFTLAGGYEFRVKPSLVVSLEAGYIMGSGHFDNGTNNSKSANGFVVRPSIKYFVNTRKNFYLQPQLFYKMVNHQMNDWLGKNCVNDVPAYEERQEFTFRRQAYGFNLMGGVLLPTRSRLIFDIYFGLGIRHRTVGVVGEPGSCYEPMGMLSIGDETGTYPNVPIGLRMLFKLD